MWVTVLQMETLYWWQESEENDQTGRSWQKITAEKHLQNEEQLKP